MVGVVGGRRRGGGALRLRAAAALVGVAAAGAAGSATSPGPAAKQANSLQDFGYFWGRSPNDGHFGPGVWPELAAFANHTTTAIVMNGGPNASAMAHNDILAIEQLRARNMTAILGTPGNVLTLAQRSLQPDYEQRWAEYWRLVKPHSSAVLAFYPFDEPTVAELEDYDTCVKLIRSTAPTDPTGRKIPIAAVVTPSSVLGIEAGTFDLPKEVDWVGFDNYECWAEAECAQLGKCCWKNRTMPHNLGVLVEYAKKRGGKTVVVPDAEYNVAYTSGCGKAGQPRCVCPVAEQEFRASIDRKYHAWCSAEESCVAMLPFLWNTVGTAKYEIIGAAQQPVLLETLKDIGTSIKHGRTAAVPHKGDDTAASVSLFVSPKGDDTAAGSQAAPFRTIEHALATARGQAGRTATVITLLAGDYNLSQTIEITAADAGPAHPLTLTAQGSAVLSGGVAVEGWVWDAAAGVWSAPLPPAFGAGKAPLRQLFVGGRRVPRPAVALAGAVNATTAADVSVIPAASRPSDPKLVGYVATDADVRGWAPNAVEAVYNGTAQEWTEHRCGVSHVLPINESATLIVMRQPCFELAMRRSGWSEKQPSAAGVGIPHFFENVRSALSPGQWCANSTAGTVDFRPLTASAGESPGEQGAVAPALESLLHIVGASHVRVAGIGLEHAAWFQPSTDTGYVGTQAGTFLTAASLATGNYNGWWMMPSALFVEGSSSVTIERCDVRRLGGAGVTFGGGSANSTVRRCRFDDVSGSAVQLGGSVRNGTLEVDSTAPAQVGLNATDNTITNLPAEYHDAVGIFGGYLFGAAIAHNSLENLSCECRCCAAFALPCSDPEMRRLGH